jgi:FkbM family methyltransferase
VAAEADTTRVAGAPREAPDLTDDAFLGGALAILQPRTGYRAGLDAVLLAAAVPQATGMRVIDVGAGVGTAGLCLARRLAEARVVLLEREEKLARIATDNIARNGLGARVRAIAGDVGMSADALAAAEIADGSFDWAIANPPYHNVEAGTLPDDALKAAAHAMPEDELDRWARFMTRLVRSGGGVTVVHKADALQRVLEALAKRFGALRVLPLQPRAGAPAHRIIVAGVKGSRAPLTILPGFVLHEADGSFTPQAQAILRSGAPLSMAPAL